MLLCNGFLHVQFPNVCEGEGVQKKKVEVHALILH